MLRMKQFDIRFAGQVQGTAGGIKPLRASRLAEDSDDALAAPYDEYERIARVVATDVEIGKVSRPTPVKSRQVPGARDLN
jgi:hypothetical protein